MTIFIGNLPHVMFLTSTALEILSRPYIFANHEWLSAAYYIVISSTNQLVRCHSKLIIIINKKNQNFVFVIYSKVRYQFMSSYHCGDICFEADPRDDTFSVMFYALMWFL